MKKLSLLLVLALGTVMALAQNGRIDLRSSSRAEITNSEFTKLNATFSFGSIESIEVNTERGTFSDISMEGAFTSGDIGSPQLPAAHQMLAVPFGATPTVEVKRFSYNDYDLAAYGIHTLMPRQPSMRKDQRPEDVPFAYNANAYQTRSLATAPEANIEVQGTMRGIQVGMLEIKPISYNATTNTLRVFNDIEVEIRFDGADRAETERMLLSTYSPYFDIVYQQMFNYRQIMDVYDDHPDLMAYPVHMIVVTPEDYISTLQPWLNWKTQKGFYLNVVTTAQAGGNYNAIKTYVQGLYNTGVSQGNTPTFLILVGDVAQVPNTTGNSSGKVTDLYYGSVDGDYFPDMFYSRISAENTTQLTATINKILQYEQYTMPDPTYLNNVTLIAGWDGTWNPTVAQPTINYATTYYYNTEHGFTNVNAYLNQSQYNGCYNTLNTGVSFINYTAHGAETSWSNPSFTVSGINALTNTDKYFLAMGNCCLTGNFGYSQPCFGEAMIRAENKAAYSYIGSCPVTYWYEDYYFAVGATHTHGGATPSNTESSTGVYDGIWMDDTYNTVSSIVFLGNLAVCHSHSGGYQVHSSPIYYWQAYHVLGDGSIMPYRVQPTANTVNHASMISPTANTFQVSAQAGSYVAISQNNVLKGTALVGNTGSVNVPVSGITAGQQVRIVVTKPQRQPYIQDIMAGTPQSFNITLSANPAEGGTVSGGGPHYEYSYCSVMATPAPGYEFVNWTEDGIEVSTSASYTFMVSGPRNLVANFQEQVTYYSIRLSANPADAGTVEGGGSYASGSEATVIATPIQRYDFLNWTENGEVVSTNSHYTFTVTRARNLVANFGTAPQTLSITATVDPEEAATVEGAGTFNYGDVVTLKLDRNEDWAFQNWTEDGEVVSEEMTYTFIATENRNLVAHFNYTEGVEEQSANRTLLYPNPVNDQLTVEAAEALSSVEVYNLMGALMSSQKNCGSKVEISTANLPSGIYFIRLKGSTISETRRFVKE